MSAFTMLRGAESPRVGNMNFDDPIAKALRYVGSYGCHEEAGTFQFDLLRAHGMRPTSRVLEIGAGCLVTGHRIIDYLEDGNYTSIEPNQWLVDAGRDFFGVRKTHAHLTVEDFDARSGTFDFIHSHSVLSHASKYQLPQYMSAVRKQLRPGGVALTSIRLAETHPSRPRVDSDAEAWDYPNVFYFTMATARSAALTHGLDMVVRPDIRKSFMAATNGEHEHDWLELRVQSELR